MPILLDYKKIGERIRKYRIQAHLTQDQLSELCNVNPSSISRIETNATSCSLALLVNIANALDVGLDSLVCDNLETVKPIYIYKDFKKETSFRLHQSGEKFPS